MNYNRLKILSGLILISATMLMESCSPAGGNRPGHEYFQDMGHSIAYEANLVDYFYYNRWNLDGYLKLAQPRDPVKGTIARGYVGLAKYSNAPVPAMVQEEFANETVNGSVPFYYADTEEDRTRAINDIKLNPYPITKKSLEHGKELYNIYCGICHGEKGDGSGYLVRDDGKYPAQPAIFTSDDFINSSNGRYYFAIMHGKNVMSSYADKLSYEERWQVIQHIRALQAESKGLKYNENENTLNKTDFVLTSAKTDKTTATTDSTSTAK
ncbi:MAG: cytochrome c [Saprospiraceae bacterium]|nr:cytochrome c [Saprospiraceae bacterium]